MRWRENWGSGRDASTSGAKNSRPSSQEKKQHVRVRTRLPAEKKTNSSSGCWPRRPWKWIFSEVPCKKSRLDARRAAKLASWDLRTDPRSKIFARQPEYRAHVPVGSGESQKFLPLAAGRASCRGRDGSPICNPADCPGASSSLRVSTHHRGAAPSRNAGEPQTGGADHAGR